MSVIRSLRIRLGLCDVGSLFEIDDGRIYFRFDDAYAKDTSRPTLSQVYLMAPSPDALKADPARALAEAEAATVAQLLDPGLAVNRGDGHFGLPPFFQNLLPEGALRQQLIADKQLGEHDEFGLLAVCGEDLPGDVWALAETLEDDRLGRLVTQGRDAWELSSGQVPTPGATSLSGQQPKLALVADAEHRYVMRSKVSATEHFIGKLPTAQFDYLPEVEFASMQLAQAAGVATCRVELKPLSEIAGQLPHALTNDQRHFLLVHRFDRDVPTPTRRLHAEDFAQVTGRPGKRKYEGSYAEIGLVLMERSRRGIDDVLELLRRITVNELLGNFDAHLKNFGLLYGPGGVQPVLSPAYDIVAYGTYLGGRGHALKLLPDQAPRTMLSPMTVRRLANLWTIPEKRLRDAITDCVDRAMSHWPSLLPDLPLPDTHRQALSRFIAQVPAAMAWRKRHPQAPWFQT